MSDAGCRLCDPDVRTDKRVSEAAAEGSGQGHFGLAAGGSSDLRSD